MFHVEHIGQILLKIILVQDGHLRYSVHNTLDTIAVIVRDNGFNNSFYKLSNRDNQDSKIGEGRATPKIPCPPLSIYSQLRQKEYSAKYPRRVYLAGVKVQQLHPTSNQNGPCHPRSPDSRDVAAERVHKPTTGSPPIAGGTCIR